VTELFAGVSSPVNEEGVIGSFAFFVCVLAKFECAAGFTSMTIPPGDSIVMAGTLAVAAAVAIATGGGVEVSNVGGVGPSRLAMVGKQFLARSFHLSRGALPLFLSGGGGGIDC